MRWLLVLFFVPNALRVVLFYFWEELFNEKMLLDVCCAVVGHFRG
jgi:hypothetical protein